MASYFLPAGLKSRLLRFALSRIDFLDGDALDLDRLNFTLGKKSTISLGDVGLRTKKISSLLPSNIQVTRASVNLLRITIPADLHTSGIVIEVDGVTVKAKAVQDSATPAARNKTRPKPSHPEAIPTPQDLAESFLQEEPAEERRELEAAISSQSQYLHEPAAAAASVYEDELEESELGTGVGLTLPSIVTNFFNGIRDRLQVSIEGVEVEVETEMPSEGWDDDETITAGVVFHIGKIAVEGLTTAGVPLRPQDASPLPSTVDSRPGKRQISLQNLCTGLLLDEKSMTRSRITSHPASSTTSTNSHHKPTSRVPSESGNDAPASPNIGGSAASFSGNDAPMSPTGRGSVASLSGNDAYTSPHFGGSAPSTRAESPNPMPVQSSSRVEGMAASTMTTDEDRFGNADEDEHRPTNPLAGSFSGSERFGQGSMYGEESFLQHAVDNGLFDSNIEEHNPSQSRGSIKDVSGSFLNPRNTNITASNTSLPARLPNDGSTQERTQTSPVSKSQPALKHGSDVEVTDRQAISTDRLSNTGNQTPSLGSDRAQSPPSPASSERHGLSQSMLFSHEEAESMYMSAFSEASTHSSSQFHIPGGWDTSSTSSGDSEQVHHPNPAQIGISPLGTIAEKDDGCDTPRPRSRADTDQIASAILGQGKMHYDKPVAHSKSFTPLADIDAVSIWVPNPDAAKSAISSDVAPSTPNVRASRVAFADASTYQEVPGSFSHYAASTARSRAGSTILRDRNRTSASQARINSDRRSSDADVKAEEGVEIEIGTVRLRLDVDTVYLISRLVKAIGQLFGDLPETPSQPSKEESRSGQGVNGKCVVNCIQVTLVKELVGHPVFIDRPIGAVRHGQLDQTDVLLDLRITNLQITANTIAGVSKSTLNIGTFALGFNDQRILSFDSSSGLEDTTVGLKKLQEHDLSLSYTQDGDRAEINASSRPLHVTLDVQKLDDTFASYGGFSGVLKIGNQIASTCTLPPLSPKLTSPVSPVVDGPPKPAPKVNARFEGLTFSLQGESCGVLLETSVIKAVVRGDKVGVSIRHAKFSGPHLLGYKDHEVPLIAEVDDTKVEYAFTPSEEDLEDLLSLITPSHFEYEADDDILIDTLLSQRRKGSFVRVRVGKEIRLKVSSLDDLQEFQCLARDVAKLSSVAKLLPDDERPGILTMVDAASCKVEVYVNDRIGSVSSTCGRMRVAHIGLPALIALEVHSMEAVRDGSETLIDQVNTPSERDAKIPCLMARMLGDEMEPTLKVKLFNLLFDYRVSTVMAVLGLSEDSTGEDVALGLASSMATIKSVPSPGITRQYSGASGKSGPPARPMNLDVLLRDCAVGLNPRGNPAKALLVLTNTRFGGTLVQDADMTANLDIRKASLLIIDDSARLASDMYDSSSRPPSSELGSRQVVDLCRLGFVSVGTTSKARAVVNISEPQGSGPRNVAIEFNNDLFVMESCADSTQTLFALFGGLAPPQPPSTETQYRTKVEPIANVMASLVGDTIPETDEDNLSASLQLDQSVIVNEEEPEGLHFEGAIYDYTQLPELDEMSADSFEPPASSPKKAPESSEPDNSEDIELNFDDDFFGKPQEGPDVQGWNSTANKYSDLKFSSDEIPLKLHVQNIHFIWNLYDGYDWPRTRVKLGQRLEEVQQRAQGRRERLERMQHGEDEDDGLEVEEDLLFGSVYVSVPVNQSAEETRRQLNMAIKGKVTDEAVSETSYATTSASKSIARSRPWHSRLHLERGRHHKITFELKGISADLVVLAPGINEVQKMVDLRVQDLEVIDHVPTSSWKKFVTYDHDQGERPMGYPMINLNVMNVRPVQDLAATELVIKVRVLPLRLHVDQDALDFITRFFEFKDDSVAPSPAPGSGGQPFIQRLDVHQVLLKLDYKPKRVDYAGLRSGRTTEFMNFVTLDGTEIKLRHCILYGVAGFDKLHDTLSGIWTPDVKYNQLSGILTGLAMVRPVANVAGGFRNLVDVPMREYKKDGRLLRSAGKGLSAFAKTTTTEILRLGAKVSIGTHSMLSGAETILSPTAGPNGGGASHAHTSSDASGWDEVSPPNNHSPAEAPRAFSHYANQPIGVRAGILSARQHLQHDFATAREAIIAIPGEVMESGSAAGAARAVVKRAPVVVLRPLTGVTRATGGVLLGAANALDRDSRRRIEDKYKRR